MIPASVSSLVSTERLGVRIEIEADEFVTAHLSEHRKVMAESFSTGRGELLKDFRSVVSSAGAAGASRHRGRAGTASLRRDIDVT